ncbi:hypothetical protein D3OALGA1CA_1597 [Olavius algarvensis associated proteobacterium Delta 3]|nr:hypothetical protein D3OALGB2SA_396 [Olavius algarvensis associated proteobacterium Delta 3]CAB5103589.1 hypothetical protein D3OALGA1CA_1597 [Olavius algarvensis associated proteobacterium Delta 3]
MTYGEGSHKLPLQMLIADIPMTSMPASAAVTNLIRHVL